MTHRQTHPSDFDRIDAQRIAGNSLALLVHAVALAILMMPSTWQPPRSAPRAETVLVDYLPPRELPIPPPPPIVPAVERRREPTPVATPQLASTPAADTIPVMNQGSQYAQPVDQGQPVDTFIAGPPGVETLAYDVHPAPRYPRQALRAGLEGRVTLRVLVDEQGWPRTVEIERSSGHRDLDRSAREHVLAKWRFHPAQRRGRAIPAYALVPIDFGLP